MKRGTIAVAAAPVAYGKPRPVLVIQDDAFDLPSLTVLPLTSDLQDAPLLRLTIMPDQTNGLQKPSQVMIDKIVTLPRSRFGDPIGEIDAPMLQAVGAALAQFLAI